jgi:hypothetical protein
LYTRRTLFFIAGIPTLREILALPYQNDVVVVPRQSALTFLVFRGGGAEVPRSSLEVCAHLRDEKRLKEMGG